MSNQNIKTKKGFTIIEVVLVLAIAGLIFLMVFIALPQLQRSQRDSQRKQDVSSIFTAVTQYQSNNKGNLPSDSSDFASYISSDIADPSVGEYTVTVEDSGTEGDYDGTLGTVTIYPSTKCGSTAGQLEKATGARMYAVITLLETGYYCVDNS